jgi:hexokinase
LKLCQIKNLKLDDLPSGMKEIIILEHCEYNNELNCLPKSIEIIKLNKLYNKKISNIPKQLKTLVCYEKYNFIDDFNDKYNVITYGKKID